MNRWAAIGAAALHGAMLGYLFWGQAPVLRSEPKQAPVRIRAVARAVEPPPAPVAAVEPARAVPEVAPAMKPAPRQARTKALEPVARPAELPAPVPSPLEPPAPATAEPPAPRPRKFTVALGATVPAGGVSVPVSREGSVRGLSGSGGSSPDDEDGQEPQFPSSSSSGALPSARRADVSELSAPPRLVYQPTEDEMRALYPQVARKDGAEGDVSLKILVATTGEVLRVRVVKAAGSGFDEAATNIVKRFRFRAAEVRGQAVEVWIPWTYKFQLEG